MSIPFRSIPFHSVLLEFTFRSISLHSTPLSSIPFLSTRTLSPRRAHTREATRDVLRRVGGRSWSGCHGPAPHTMPFRVLLARAGSRVRVRGRPRLDSTVVLHHAASSLRAARRPSGGEQRCFSLAHTTDGSLRDPSRSIDHRRPVRPDPCAAVVVVSARARVGARASVGLGVPRGGYKIYIYIHINIYIYVCV